MKNRLKELENFINYKFNSKDILKKCLTHKSLDENINNEKLEFLGDRVLGLIISKNLLEKYPNEKEGIIDKKFANLVNKKRCAEISNKINLINYMFLGSNYKKKDQKNEKISGDCLEALIGAIYQDHNFKIAEKFILNFWSDHIKKSIITQIDAKTKLQEFSLKKYKKLPTYKIISNTGPRHKPLFKVGVKLENSKFFISEGKSKKDAEQNAAYLCLKDLN